jgi:hypothetical protein
VTLKKALIIMPHCYTMFRRGSTSSLNFSTDVIKIRSAETKAETETDCTKTETKTGKKQSRQAGADPGISGGEMTWTRKK